MKILAYGKAQELVNKNVAKGGANILSTPRNSEMSERSSTLLDDASDQRNLQIFKMQNHRLNV